MWKNFVLCVAIATFGVVPALATAQDETEQAVSYSRQAAEAYEAGDLAAAAALYEQAFLLVEDPAFAFNLGAVYDELGEIANAYRYFSRYVQLYPGASDRAEIEAYLAELLPQIETTYARLAIESRPTAATVYRVVDGTEMVLGRTPLDVWVDPGDQRLVLRTSGYVDEAVQLRAVAGVRVERTIELDPVPLVAAPVVIAPAGGEMAFVPDAPVVVEPDVRDSNLTGRQRTGLVIAGTGVGVVAAGAAFLAVGHGAQVEHNRLVGDISPEAPADPAELDRLERQARSMKVTGNATLFSGVAVAATGIVLFVTGRSREVSDSRVDLGPVGRGWGLVLQRSF